jgi:hypothetical protein
MMPERVGCVNMTLDAGEEGLCKAGIPDTANIVLPKDLLPFLDGVRGAMGCTMISWLSSSDSDPSGGLRTVVGTERDGDDKGLGSGEILYKRTALMK